MIYPYQCFEYDAEMEYYYGVSMPTVNKIEQAFTVNIVYVTSGRPLHAYYISGHDGPTHKTLDDMLKTLGFVSSDLNLKSADAEIPKDCELLILLQPKSDLTLSE